LRFLQIGATIAGMALPIEFENELLRWLDARLDERFKRQQRALLEGVVEMVTAMMNEQLKLGGEACKLELGEEFAKLQSLVAEYESTVNRLQALFEQMQRLDRAAPGEHSTKIN
jgi:hypothetical protein